MTELGLHLSLRGVELAIAVFLLVTLWRIVAAAARDTLIGNGNTASYAHLAIQAVAIVIMLGFVAMLSACGATSSAPKTERSMLAWRLAHPGYPRACPVGRELAPDADPARDGCDDPYGLEWTSCAWNAEGRYMSTSELMSPARLTGCGTDGMPDCGSSR